MKSFWPSVGIWLLIQILSLPLYLGIFIGWFVNDSNTQLNLVDFICMMLFHLLIYSFIYAAVYFILRRINCNSLVLYGLFIPVQVLIFVGSVPFYAASFLDSSNDTVNHHAEQLVKEESEEIFLEEEEEMYDSEEYYDYLNNGSEYETIASFEDGKSGELSFITDLSTDELYGLYKKNDEYIFEKIPLLWQTKNYLSFTEGHILPLEVSNFGEGSIQVDKKGNYQISFPSREIVFGFQPEEKISVILGEKEVDFSALTRNILVEHLEKNGLIVEGGLLVE